LPELNPEEYKDPQQPHFNSFIKNLHPFAYVIIVLAVIFFLYQIIGGSISIAAGGGLEDINVKISRIILIFSQFMFILAPTLFFMRLQTAELKSSFRLNLPKPHLLLFAVVGMVLIQPALQGYMFLQDYGLDHMPVMQNVIKEVRDLFDTLEKAEMKIVSAYSVYEYIIVVFAICVTPAICEELLFRGFVMRNLEKIAKPSIAIFLTGFLFALYHFQPLNLVALMMLGIYLGFVVYCSDSIYTGMVCHFLNNFFASYLFYKYGKEDFETPRISSSQKMDAVILGAASIILISSLMILMYRMRTKRHIEGVEA